MIWMSGGWTIGGLGMGFEVWSFLGGHCKIVGISVLVSKLCNEFFQRFSWLRNLERIVASEIKSTFLSLVSGQTRNTSHNTLKSSTTLIPLDSSKKLFKLISNSSSRFDMHHTIP